MYITKIIK